MDKPAPVAAPAIIVPPRRREWDGAAAVIAAFVGLLALCVSGYTAYIQRQQVRAQVWPYLETGLSPSKQELTLANKGVGPALIRSVQIFVDDKPQHDWDAVYTALGLKYAQHPAYSTINGVVISAGERIDQVVFKDADTFNLYVRQAKRVSMRVCYCSTMNECWVRDSRETESSRITTEIAACPARNKDDFIDNENAVPAVPAKDETK